MRRFWQIMALLQLVLLAPTSVHCLLDAEISAANPAFERHHHGHVEHTPAHDDHDENEGHSDPCKSLESTILPSTPAVPAMPVMALTHEMESLLMIAAQAPVLIDDVTFKPPVAPAELRSCWAFLTRAALPARSPSDLV